MYGGQLEKTSQTPTKTPENRTFDHFNKKTCKTFVIQKNDTKYLEFRQNTYYFVLRYRKTIIKYSLKNDNLYQSQIYRNTILLNLKPLIKLSYVDTINITYSSNLIVRETVNKIKNRVKDINMSFLEDIQKDPEYTYIGNDEELDEILDIYQSLTLKQRLKLQELIDYNNSFNIPSIENQEIIYSRDSNFQYAKSVEEKEKVLTIREGFEKWLKYKINIDKVKESSVKTYKSGFKYLLLFIDEDKKIDTFTTKDFKLIHEYFPQLPKNTFQFKLFKDRTLPEILELNEIEDNETLKNKTINNHFFNYRSLFEYFIYEELLEKNPVNVRLLNINDSERTHFEHNDLVTLFSTIQEKELRDLLVISLYTGMRISEILLLKKTDIENDIIKIVQGKTKNSIREVYIHSKIKDIIKHYLNTNETEFLMFDGNTNKTTKTINRRIKKSLNDDRKTFHSCRKSFVNKLLKIENRQIEYIQKIIGHSISKTSKLTTEIYGGEYLIPRDILKTYIEFINYDFE